MPRATENRGNRQQLRQLGHTCDAKKPNAIRVMEGASGPLPVDRWLININFAPFSISYCQLAVVSPPHFRRLQIIMVFHFPGTSMAEGFCAAALN